MYSNEIRKQAIDLHARGTPVTEICSRLQIGRSTLYLWLQQADPNHPKTIPRVEFYNDYRPHQRLGYLTPNKVEDEYYSQNKTMATSE